MSIPKFRLTTRLIQWINENYHQNTRLPKNIEEVFLKSKEDPHTIANNLAQYAQKVYKDDLDEDLENVIKKHPSATTLYIQHLLYHGKPIKNLLDCLKGHGEYIAQMAQSLGRLKDYEDQIQHPEHFVKYVANIRFHDGKASRIPEMENRIFNNNNFPKNKIAGWIAQYAAYSESPLTEELKELLKNNGDHIIEYAHTLRNWGKTLDQDLLDSLAGDDRNLLKYAQNHLQKRLPSNLEKTMSDPQTLLNYAKTIVKGRLTEELENHFAKDHIIASSYAFEVIRGFACVRLPDVVHSAMVMQSCANPNDYYIKRYITECEKYNT